MSAGLSRRLSRASTARVNYVFRDGSYNLNSETTPIRLHDIELGYDLDLAAFADQTDVHLVFRRSVVRGLSGAPGRFERSAASH